MRRLLDLSRPQLAKMAGIHPMTLYKWETGRAEPGMVEFASVARAMRVPMHELFEVVE
jgi:DNA-binding XRE family transcriptional regulator